MTEEQKNQEVKESNNLIERGLDFSVPMISPLQYLYKKKNRKRKFVIRQPYLGALDMMGNEFLKLDVNEENAMKDILNEAKILSTKAVDNVCTIIAIMVLGSSSVYPRLQIQLFKKILAKYFKWRITPSVQMQLTFIILQLCNHADFINSIRLMRVARTTSPQLIEGEQADSKALGE